MAIAVEQHPEAVGGFRAELRPPRVEFARCGITGEYGKCVSVDLGDMVVQAPGYNRPDGTWVAPEEITYLQNLTISAQGLDLLRQAIDGAENPLPVYTPNLAYQWQIMYDNGSAEAQFRYNEHGEEYDVKFPLDRVHEIAQFSLVSRKQGAQALPTYTVNVREGRFFRAGVELDTGYPFAPPGDQNALCVRKTHITFASIYDPETMQREATPFKGLPLYIIGWKVGGWPDQGVACNLIAVDETGAWRQYEQLMPV